MQKLAYTWLGISQLGDEIRCMGGVSDGCQMWRLFSRPGLGDGVVVSC